MSRTVNWTQKDTCVASLPPDTSRQIPVAAVRLVEKVFAPSLVRPPDVAHDLAVDVQREGARSPNQMHARFLGRAAPLLVVATSAARDQSVPGALPAARARQHVVALPPRGRDLATLM